MKSQVPYTDLFLCRSITTCTLKIWNILTPAECLKAWTKHSIWHTAQVNGSICQMDGRTDVRAGLPAGEMGGDKYAPAQKRKTEKKRRNVQNSIIPYNYSYKLVQECPLHRILYTNALTMQCLWLKGEFGCKIHFYMVFVYKCILAVKGHNHSIRLKKNLQNN